MKVFLSYALSLVGLGVVVAAVIGAAMVNLSYPGARLRLLNMLQQSVNKAEIMCRTMKHTFYEPLGAAIKVGAMSQTTDLAILAASTKPTYDGACIMVTMHWKKLFGRGKIGVLMVAGGLALAFTNKGTAIPHIIVAVLTAIAAAWFIFTRSENERSLVRARAEVLPAVDQAFAEGRYTRYG